MSNDIQFIDGLIVKAPNENAPEYVKAKLSIKREELIAWLQGQSGEWINVEVKESKGGKWYAAVDAWKPEGSAGSGGSRGGAPNRERTARVTDDPAAEFEDDPIPFATNRSAW
ncbi:MAG: hypothetical protein ACTS5I_10590 [Rhodanobacter sp.]